MTKSNFYSSWSPMVCPRAGEGTILFLCLRLCFCFRLLLSVLYSYTMLADDGEDTLEQGSSMSVPDASFFH